MISPSIITTPGEFGTETKFLIDSTTARAVRGWAMQNLEPDPYCLKGSYNVTSLYFDTKYFDVLERRGSYGRSKYRVRRYGEADGVFLERKLKTRNRVGKTRSQVALGELPRLDRPEPERSWGGFWFHRRLVARSLRPVCQVTYRRSAFVGMAACGPIRLTIDQEVIASPVAGAFFDHFSPGRDLYQSGAILELKYRNEAPVLFKRLLETFALNPQPISKYRLAARALDCRPAA